MYSPCSSKAKQARFHGFCPASFHDDGEPERTTSKTTAAVSRLGFEAAMASSIAPDSHFTNHESLPSLNDSFCNFTQIFPLYSETEQADKIREQEYYHLLLSKHVCLDYTGHGLFSYYQQQSHSLASNIPSTSSSFSSPSHYSISLEPPFFDISCKSVNFRSQIQYGGEKSELDYKIKKRIMAFMNISEDDYAVVFTANQSSAFNILSESYPFHLYRNLLTVYDHENEAVDGMLESSKKRGARVMSANFSWPSLRIHLEKLRKKMVSKGKNRKRGLFVFPLLSRITGARYPYIWMSMARENGWHVLLDACALGPKEMETLGLSLFKPDFLICSFFKVFGENPSGFGCLFVKRTSAAILQDSNIGIVSLVPAAAPSHLSEASTISAVKTEQNENPEAHYDEILGVPASFPEPSKQMTDISFELHEIEEFGPAQSRNIESNTSGCSELECRSLDHADSLGLILISRRTRFLINWLINAFTSLKHPNSESGSPLVRIYGPKIKFDRGPAVAFNVFDWKGKKIDPAIIQKLADRNNISLSNGNLQHIWFSDRHTEESERVVEAGTSKREGSISSEKVDRLHSGISVVTASLGFMTNFEDIYRLWSFISRFLDADFVEKERWRYTALDQKMIEI